MIALREEFEPGESLTARTREMFAPTGVMGGARNFEFRPQQQEMAVAVARALSDQRHLVVEAGTGVGKSLAYLAPAVLHAIEHKRKAVISTHTINLQEQLIDKDIPILKKLLDEDFTAALFKGRQNYLCPRRLQRARQQAGELFTGGQHSVLDELHLWSLKTSDGSLSDLPREPEFAVWSQVCSEAHICTPKTCGPDSGCFYQAARRRVQSAQVVVLNHALFFVLLGAAMADRAAKEAAAEVAGQGPPADLKAGYLFEDDFVIFDEAHTIEAVAARQIGVGVSHAGLRHALQRLYHPRTRKGLWTLLHRAEGVRVTTALLEEVDAFFGRIDGTLDFKRGGRECRIRQPEMVEDTIGEALERLSGMIESAAMTVGDEMTRSELGDLGRRLDAAREGIALFIEQRSPDYVYWVERTGKAEQNLSLNAAPVDLAGTLHEMLFRPDTSAIMTSATLSVGNPELLYFRDRVGAVGAGIDVLQIGSPFDYAKQMKLCLAPKMPETPREAGYEEALARWITRLGAESKGGTFVLFTNYKLMQALAGRTRDFFEDRDRPLLVQGDGLSRRRLLETFRTDPRSVLFGTDSFWSGVDVPGEGLSTVIITQLPFSPPDSPLTEARCERIRERGGDPFSEYSLPEAILKLRQGVGRLIRTKQDSGIIAILDSRMVRKPYGRAFLAALPKCPVSNLTG
jgi:ATP-dependent DNA helicase DinG